MSHRALIERLQHRLGLDPESIGRTALHHAIDEAGLRLGARDANALLAQVERSDQDWQRFIDCMVVPETWFFRVPEQFADLLRFARTELAQRRPLRILSLPCASGEEAYSIAVTLLDAGFSSQSFEVLGIDVSERVVAQARAAHYRSNALRGQSLDPSWFDMHDGVTTPTSAVRRPVSFRVGNVLQAGVFAPGERFDIIFCRNLLIYLDADARRLALEQLLAVLENDGLILAGQAEVLSSMDRRLQPLDGYGPLSFVRARPPPAAALNLTVPKQVVAASNPPRRVVSAAPPRIRPTIDQPNAASGSAEILTLARKDADGGRLDSARAQCAAALQGDPENAALWLLLGEIEMANGDLEAADRALVRASYLERDHLEALQHRVALAERLGRPHEAAQLRSRLLRSRRPSDAP